MKHTFVILGLLFSSYCFAQNNNSIDFSDYKNFNKILENETHVFIYKTKWKGAGTYFEIDCFDKQNMQLVSTFKKDINRENYNRIIGVEVVNGKVLILENSYNKNELKYEVFYTLVDPLNKIEGNKTEILNIKNKASLDYVYKNDNSLILLKLNYKKSKVDKTDFILFDFNSNQIENQFSENQLYKDNKISIKPVSYVVLTAFMGGTGLLPGLVLSTLFKFKLKSKSYNFKGYDYTDDKEILYLTEDSTNKYSFNKIINNNKESVCFIENVKSNIYNFSFLKTDNHYFLATTVLYDTIPNKNKIIGTKVYKIEGNDIKQYKVYVNDSTFNTFINHELKRNLLNSHVKRFNIENNEVFIESEIELSNNDGMFYIRNKHLVLLSKMKIDKNEFNIIPLPIYTLSGSSDKYIYNQTYSSIYDSSNFYYKFNINAKDTLKYKNNDFNICETDRKPIHFLDQKAYRVILKIDKNNLETRLFSINPNVLNFHFYPNEINPEFLLINNKYKSDNFYIYRNKRKFYLSPFFEN
jgi:hypothetical protein